MGFLFIHSFSHSFIQQIPIKTKEDFCPHGGQSIAEIENIKCNWNELWNGLLCKPRIWGLGLVSRDREDFSEEVIF